MFRAQSSQIRASGPGDLNESSGLLFARHGRLLLPLSICSARTGAAGLHTPANAKRSKWSGRSRLFRHPGARTLASLVAQIFFDVEQRNAETVSANDAVWRHAFKVFR
jgi:hypothetical protein